MTNSYVQIEQRDDIRLITLTRPEKLNAWTAAMRGTITEAIDDAASDTAISAVVFTGSGRGFCAGQDLAETAEFDPKNSLAATEWVDGFQRLYSAVRNLDKPVIAAINGVAAGSGFQFALLADLRIGHVDVRMGQPEVLSGIPSVTGIWAMLGTLGKAKTVEFALTGQLVDGAEAHRLGLLTTLVDEDQVLSTALDSAARLTALPLGAVALTKSVLRSLDAQSFDEAFAMARDIHASAFSSGEPQREMNRFFTRHTGTNQG